MTSAEAITDLFGNADEEAMYQSALRVPLEYKIEMAIDLIRCFEKQALALSEDGYYVCFSGGKDSIVMAKLFEMAGVKYTLNYSNVTIDPPELVQYIKRHYPQTIWNKPECSLPMYMGRHPKGPPTRIGRWCCQVYKESIGNGAMKAVGVRAEESSRRKGLWQTVKVDTRTKLPILSPILYWSEAEVWAFIHQNEMPYCPLYDEGFKRLGCIGCPLSSPEQQRKEFDRWPKYEELWKRGFKAHMDNYKGVPRRDGGDRWIEKFETWEELWDWWMKREDETDQPDCQLYLW